MLKSESIIIISSLIKDLKKQILMLIVIFKRTKDERVLTKII